MSLTDSLPLAQEESLTWLSAYTKEPVFNREHGRMHRQHALVRDAMRDQLICAPVGSPAPLSELHILDSACNDGTGVLDVIANRKAELRVPGTTKLSFLGTDLDQKHFSGLEVNPTLLSNINTTFQVQDTRQPWPADLQGRFDLVHQRFALQYLGDSDESAQKAVARMVALAKPGAGWIQLVEANVVGWAQGSRVRLPALQRARQMTLDFCAQLSINPYSHQSLERWLTEAGVVDVELRHFEWGRGWGDGAGEKRVEEFARVSGDTAIGDGRLEELQPLQGGL